MKLRWTGILFPALFLFFSLTAQAQDKLHLDVYVADEDGWCVTSTLIYGKTEGILIDTQYYKSRAIELANRIAAKGVTLKAVIITHPHDDHYLGAGTIHQRFPSAPMYMMADGIEEFKRGSTHAVGWLQKNLPAEAPDTLITPEALPATHFIVDGHPVEVRQGQGDEMKASNTYVWIPSLKALITGDIVFNGVHVWLATSNQESRAAWLNSLADLGALHPRIVVAGHKKSPATPDTPDAIGETVRYIRDFEAATKTTSSAEELVAVMKAKYPDFALANKILWQAAKKAFPKSN